MSQHGQITQNTQIGNVSVEQMAMSMGSNLDHLVEGTRRDIWYTSIYRRIRYPGRGDHMTSTML